jgi:hypothetical protein
MRWLRSLAALAALAAAVLLWADAAVARSDGKPGYGVGPLGAAMALPVSAPERLILAAADHAAPSQSSSPGSLGGFFNRPGVLGGFAAGLLGAGPLGLLFGYGLVGELGSAASYFGLFAQLLLIAMLGRVIWSWWTGRNQRAFTGLSPRQLADPYLRTRHEASPGLEPSVDDDHGGDHESESRQTAHTAAGSDLKG